MKQIDPEIFSEAVAAATIATTIQYVVGSSSLSPMRVFTVNALACMIYNEILREKNKPKTVFERLRRGLGYGLLAAGISIVSPPLSPIEFFLQAAVASASGNLIAPEINSLIDRQSFEC
jgi:hypothetical protein